MQVSADISDNPLAMKKIRTSEELETYFINQTNISSPENRISTTGTINSGKLSPVSPIVAPVGITDQLLLNGGKPAEQKTFNFDSKDTSGANNVQTEKLLTYAASEGTHLEGEAVTGGIKNYQKSYEYTGGINPDSGKPDSSVSSENKKVASAYSSTNVQVRGVDEPDFVKNDGKYIYLISNHNLVIVDAYPADNAHIISKMPIDGDVSDIFLNGDRIVVFTGRNDPEWVPVPGSVTPVPNHVYQTHALVYSVMDRKDPVLLRDIVLPGSYRNARMIDRDIYVLSQETRNTGDYQIPVISEGGSKIPVSEVWCPPTMPADYVFYTLSSFSLNNDAKPQAESFVLGRESTLYVSPENVYVAYRNQYPDLRGTGPSGQETVIHRFGIRDGRISYKATGLFPGYLLNQFSLDEYQGNIRVAATTDYSGQGSGRSSGVYILDPDLRIIGTLENLAPGEKIYSARFMGEMLYLVTFRLMDPLFAIDLSNPKHPVVRSGELKIPGYSDYLHPYDETHLIGIGKDTKENPPENGVRPMGLKIALFDVSDYNHPQEVGHVNIGSVGSDSEALRDHRAFLFDREKNIMVIPVKEVSESVTGGTWQGTYVFGIDPEKGFTGKGKVEQGNAGSPVRRSLFMDSILYTISDQNIIASDLDDLVKRFADLSLGS